MIFWYNSIESQSLISDISDIANIIIALVNLVLAGYIFVYQKEKDRKSNIETLINQERNIRLQWFKELIIQPHIDDISTYYQSLHNIENKFNTPIISEDLKQEINTLIKYLSYEFRRSFIDSLRKINPEMYNEIKSNIDSLTDELSEIIFDAGLNLNDKTTYERYIGSKITYSKNEITSIIFQYKGD